MNTSDEANEYLMSNLKVKNEVGTLGPYNISDYPITIVVIPLIYIVVPLLPPCCYLCAP